MKTALTIMTLGLSLWAIPAPATPSRAETPPGLAVSIAARSARATKQVDVELRSDWKEVAGLSRRQAGLVRVRGGDLGDRKDEWHATTKPVQVGSAVPEPSATTLFGVGVLLALQAIPRRRGDSSVDDGATGAPETA